VTFSQNPIPPAPRPGNQVGSTSPTPGISGGRNQGRGGKEEMISYDLRLSPPEKVLLISQSYILLTFFGECNKKGT